MNSSELRGFLTGLILGDGTIGKGVSKRAFLIKSVNKDFIDMIEKEIESCSGFKSRIRFIPAHYSSGCNHKDSWEYIIPAHPYFNKMYHHFYDDSGHRIISNSALKWLTPRGIANWYMSDGYICLVGRTKGVIRDRRVDLCTDRYSLKDIYKVQRFFQHTYEIDTALIKRDNFRRIRICKSSYEKFFSIISPYIVPSMKYKLYLGYEQQPIWMPNELWDIQKELQEDLNSANPLSVSA